MMRKLLLVFIAVFTVLSMNAQSKLGLYTSAFLENYAGEKARSAVDAYPGVNRLFAAPKLKNNSIATIGAFITLEEGGDVEALKALGTEVYAQVGNILTVEIPIDRIVEISELKDVKRLEVEKPVKLLMEKSRGFTNADDVQVGTGLNRAYTGTGVVVGICDTGIEFNHIAFKDEYGNSRVKRAYLPDDNTGTRPSGTDIYGNAFGGSEYATPEKIGKLTTDNSLESHGSHTANIAAGSYFGNQYYGNATGADLVLCGIKRLTDLNIANSVLYTLRYAKSVGKPAVVSLSIGGHEGAHDGSSDIVMMLDEMSGEGHIISLSAGNEGEDYIYITKSFQSSTDELKTFLFDLSDERRSCNAYIDAWSRNTSAIGVKGVVYDVATKKIVYQTPVFKPARYSSVEHDSNRIPELAKYYTGKIVFYSVLESGMNNKYHSVVSCELKIPNYDTSVEQPGYAFGLVYTGDAGVQMDAWAADGRTFFIGGGVSGWTTGSSDCSISDMATGDNTISVGSYDSRDDYKNINNQTLSWGGYFKPGQISSFSSYGPDMRGIKRPDIVAPGAMIVSAVNGYDNSTVGVMVRSDLAAQIKVGTRTQYWGPMMGTSMSCPAVAGIIALWLEADKTLTSARIKEILKKTSINDKYVISGNANRWGYGKIDAYAGLVEVLKGATGIEAEKNINKVVISSLGSRTYRIYAPGETGKVTVNIYSPNGSLLYTTVGGNEGEIEVTIPEFGGNGVNIMQVIGEKTNYRTKIAL